MSRRLRLLMLLAGLAGLAAPAAPAASAAAAPPRAKASLATAHRSVLPWIEDDYPRALARARERKLPLFVESWAPW